jgi:hypothetical protein
MWALKLLLTQRILSRSNFRGVRHAYVPNNAARGRAGSSNLDLLILNNHLQNLGEGEAERLETPKPSNFSFSQELGWEQICSEFAKKEVFQ